jgi:hypothetical protein
MYDRSLETLLTGAHKAAFDRKMIKHLVEIVLHATAIMSFWEGLFNTEVGGSGRWS